MILTTHVFVNDVLTIGRDSERRLFISDDGNYGEKRWHRVPGLQHTVMRTIFVGKGEKARFITQRRHVPDVSRYPAEREPKMVWSRAYHAYVPYPVEYASMNVQPEREHVGYTTIEPVDGYPPVEPYVPVPPPPIAEGPRSVRPAPVLGTVSR